MFWNQIKTTLLLGSLSGLLFFLGYIIGGQNGIMIAFILSLCMNFITYFFSDRIVLSMYNAQPLDKNHYSHIYEMVQELATEMHIPMPKLWYVPTKMANAFATGRNPEHSSVAVTQGILDILDAHELRGVLAHELSHIKNRDILVGTVAATLATTIGYVADMMRWSLFWGNGRDNENRGGALGALVIAILMPIAAMLIQLAVSRSREYLADETGAHCSRDPLALASALQKLSDSTKHNHWQPTSQAQATTASLFIVYPFMGKLTNLFSTHPPMEKRIARLRKMAQ
jgi:heat shock protein HtpX